MSFLWAILFGAVLGVLSALLAKRRDPGFLIVRTIIGIIGGAIAGLAAVTIAPTTASSIWISVGGLIVLFIIWWIIAGKRKTT
jgi:uncharacterized membrane protein YeaQ/YmgE (transglycosylase-associated protein family)